MPLASQIRVYNREFAQDLEDELAAYRRIKPFKELIRRATLGIAEGETMHSHQRRLGYKLLERQARILLRHEKTLKNSRSFAQLIATIEQHSLRGVAKLAQYDTALRIGARRNLFPPAVYLHTGALDCYHNLGFRDSPRTVDLEDLPKPIRALAPHHIENFLCIFKDCLGTDRKDTRRSACGPMNSRRNSC